MHSISFHRWAACIESTTTDFMRSKDRAVTTKVDWIWNKWWLLWQVCRLYSFEAWRRCLSVYINVYIYIGGVFRYCLFSSPFGRFQIWRVFFAWVESTNSIDTYGGFLKWWYLQIIHFNRVFHYKPSILGYPFFWKHPYIHIYTHYVCNVLF